MPGWGVFRMNPWHFAGLYSTHDEAEAEKHRLGNAYEFAHGTHIRGTDEFVQDAGQQPD